MSRLHCSVRENFPFKSATHLAFTVNLSRFKKRERVKCIMLSPYIDSFRICIENQTLILSHLRPSTCLEYEGYTVTHDAQPPEPPATRQRQRHCLRDPGLTAHLSPQSCERRE